jgi:hypothetical protein
VLSGQQFAALDARRLAAEIAALVMRKPSLVM